MVGFSEHALIVILLNGRKTTFTRRQLVAGADFEPCGGSCFPDNLGVKRSLAGEVGAGPSAPSGPRVPVRLVPWGLGPSPGTPVSAARVGTAQSLVAATDGRTGTHEGAVCGGHRDPGCGSGDLQSRDRKSKPCGGGAGVCCAGALPPFTPHRQPQDWLPPAGHTRFGRARSAALLSSLVRGAPAHPESRHGPAVPGRCGCFP